VRKLRKVISGAQTGVDRAGLDAALAVGLEIGGWCPKGRRSEDGKIPAKYPLEETPDWRYPQRTEWNVRDADATVIVAHDVTASRGTKLTWRLAKKHNKIVIDLLQEQQYGLDFVADLLKECEVINVAGPRETSVPGIYDEAFRILQRLFSQLKAPR
jgi:hypothetical protein